jgi:hypothetical protein
MLGVRTAAFGEERHGSGQDLLNGAAIGRQIEVTARSRMLQATPLIRKKPPYREAPAPEMDRFIAGVQVDEHIRARHYLPHAWDIRVLLAALSHLVAQAL